MNLTSIAKNYGLDLYKSTKEPLLIELNRQDLEGYNAPYNADNSHKLPLLAANAIYNYELKEKKSKKTNLIYLNMSGSKKHNKNSFILLEVLIDKLRLPIEEIKNIEVLKSATSGGLSIVTGGLVEACAGGSFDKGIDFVFEGLNEFVSETLTENITNNINVADFIQGALSDFIGDIPATELAKKIENLEQKDIHLSKDAKRRINKLANACNKGGDHNIFQFAFKLLLSVCDSFPKLLFINDPHKLDINSLELISLLLSHSKYHRDKPNNNNQHIGLSIVFQYTNELLQPYKEVSPEYQLSKIMVDEQRCFAQRYGMLERPNTNTPKRAVKSTVFIGRDEEIDLLFKAYKDNKKGFISVVSGEPGIGKTTLVNAHLAEIQKGKRCISLTLVNEIGHTSRNTGLSSLESSIINEAIRLELLNKWRKKGEEFVSSQISIENTVKAIGVLFGVNVSGLDKLASVGGKILDRIKIGDTLDATKQFGQSDLNHQEQKTKEKQFKNLNEAITRLITLSDKTTPITLFIDDIQWIDNTSAEYIISHINKHNIYIVATLRPSDAGTIFKSRLKEDDKSYQDNQFVNFLFSKLDLRNTQFDSNHIKKRLKTEKNYNALNGIRELKSETIHLEGLDIGLLKSILGATIAAEQTQISLLADGIFKALSNKKAELTGSTGTVNSLFAIEAINILCDKVFYSSKGIPELIINIDREKSKHTTTNKSFEINSDITDVSTAINEVFELLIESYKSSLNHYSSQEGNGAFGGLMAYAVMEERLNLIKIYFKDYGDAAVNTLLFSSFIGVPFSSLVVNKIIEKIMNSKDRELRPIRELFTNKNNITLTAEHFDILDELYEIIKRLSNKHNEYNYKHGLLKVFFNQQLKFTLSNVEICQGSLGSGLGSTYFQFLSIINNVIDNELSSLSANDFDSIRVIKTGDLLEAKMSAAHFIYDISGGCYLPINENLIKTTIDIGAYLQSINKSEKAIQLLENIKNDLDRNALIIEGSSSFELEERIFSLLAALYKRKDPTLSYSYSKKLNSYRKMRPIEPEKRYELYISKMGLITSECENEIISKDKAFKAFENIFNNVLYDTQCDKAEKNRLCISLSLNMASTTLDINKKEKLFKQAEEIAYYYHKSSSRENGSSLECLVEVKMKFANFWSSSSYELNIKTKKTYECYIEAYKLMTKGDVHEQGYFDSFYYTCILGLLAFRCLEENECQKHSIDFTMKNRLFKKIELLSLPNFNEFSAKFNSLKNEKPEIYQHNLNRFKVVSDLVAEKLSLSTLHQLFKVQCSPTEFARGWMSFLEEACKDFTTTMKHLNFLLENYKPGGKSEFIPFTIWLSHQLSLNDGQISQESFGSVLNSTNKIVDTELSQLKYLDVMEPTLMALAKGTIFQNTNKNVNELDYLYLGPLLKVSQYFLLMKKNESWVEIYSGVGVLLNRIKWEVFPDWNEKIFNDFNKYNAAIEDIFAD